MSAQPGSIPQRDALERVMQAMQQIAAGPNSLTGGMVESALDELDDRTREAAAAREAATACAAPRWFTEDLLAGLVDPPLNGLQAENVLRVMLGWDFVKRMGHGRFAFRDDARAYLLEQLRVSPANFRLLNERAYRYFQHAVGLTGAPDETVWLRLRPEQVGALREMLYHLLQIDLERGFALFRVLFRGAHQYRLVGEAAGLLRFVLDGNPAALSAGYRDELAYFEAVQAAADYHTQAAETALRGLLERALEQKLRARVLVELGKIEAATGRPEAALEHFGAAQAIWEALDRPRESAAAANNSGSVYLGQGRYAQARRAFEQAVAVLREDGSPLELAQALNNLGAACEGEEEWGRALEQYRLSLEIKQQAGDAFGAARTQVNMGTLYHSQIRDTDNPRRAAQLRDDALGLYNASLQTFRQFGARSETARVLYKLALLYYQSGQVEQARAVLPEALAEYRALTISGLESAEKLASRLSLPG